MMKSDTQKNKIHIDELNAWIEGMRTKHVQLESRVTQAIEENQMRQRLMEDA